MFLESVGTVLWAVSLQLSQGHPTLLLRLLFLLHSSIGSLLLPTGSQSPLSRVALLLLSHLLLVLLLRLVLLMAVLFRAIFVLLLRLVGLLRPLK